MPRILFLSQCLPFPPHSGVANRTYNILHQLRRSFHVTLLAFSRRNHQRDDAERALAAEELARLGVDVLAPVRIPSETSVAGRACVHLRSWLTNKPYTYYEYRTRTYHAHLRRALQTALPKMVHLDSLDLYGWLPELPKVPLACTHHNIESQLLRLRADRSRPRVLARYIMHQAALVERVERQICPRLDLNVMMSDLDAARLQRIAPGSRTITVPNGVDTRVLSPADPAFRVPGRVTFLGPTYMFPNRDAVDFFLERSWPTVYQKVFGASFHLVGRNPAADSERFSHAPNVFCNGHVPDVRPHLAAASCCVVPIRVGGGTRLKILDAWAMGKAVVATTNGCEGLATRDGENLLIRDDPTAFAEAVIQVLENDELRLRLEEGGRRTAVEMYDWDAIGQGLAAAYLELIRTK